MPPKPPLTHFLCLPLVTSLSKPQLQSSLQRFIADVATREGGHNEIPSKAIRPLGTLHLTLGVMSLLMPERVRSALEFLGRIDVRELLLSLSLGNGKEGEGKGSSKGLGAIMGEEEGGRDEDVHVRSGGGGGGAMITKDGQEDVPVMPLVISLTGLEPMHTPSSTSILYTSPLDYTSRLYPFCLALQTAFVEAGFLVPDTRPLRLHVTIVNTVYAKEKSARRKGGGHGKDRKGVVSLDARELLERCEGFVWAEEVRLERVSICEMGAKKVEEGEEVEYFEVGSVELP